jgi:hypothetical protein
MSDDTLEHTLQNFDLNQNGSLLSAAKFLTTISHVLEQDYLHIVVRPGELPVNIPTLTSRLITV